MLPGSDYIYLCPECKTPVVLPSLASGNTFGADFFSDGRCFAPMLPEYPEITKCRNCKTIFWLRGVEPAEEFDFGKIVNSQYAETPHATFPELSDYIELLEEVDYIAPDEEIYFRKQVLWQINDFIRWGQSFRLEEELEVYFNDNIRRLLELLPANSVNEKLLRAELYRNLGEFDECNRILSNIRDDNYAEIVTQLLNECQKLNTSVIKLEIK